jgi:hypothetical protein
MNISKILLLCIICIIVVLIINKCTNYLNKEYITNNLPNNNIVAQGENNILIPTSDQVYNPNDSNRPGNSYSYQETSLSNNNKNTDIVNTDIDIPLVYSRDEITDTTIKHKCSPSRTNKMIDAGSGIIDEPDEINNNILNNFRSLE